MSALVQRPRLGRGLAALIGDVGEAPAAAIENQRSAPISALRASRLNPRQSFADEQLDELASSIRARGLVQPLLVRPIEGEAGTFEIVAGERRWRAAQRAGLHEVPIVIRRLSDRDALEAAIIENVQRADLTAIEEARGYRDLKDRFVYNQDELGQIIGKSRSHVANTLRLLTLPDEVQAMLADGRLTAGHARALIGRENALALAQAIFANGLNVRQAEALGQAAKPSSGRSTGGKAPVTAADANIRDLETRLADVLGLKVAIRTGRGEAGEITIRYASLEQLEHIQKKLGA